MTKGPDDLSVEVCHAFPWEPAFHPLREVIEAHDGDIRMAFAYVRKITVDLLSPYIERINRPESYLIAAPESATCDEALGELARLAPNFVYFHHGRPGVFQSEAPTWGGIMHSKVALSMGDKNATAWLGSHNLSERALGGINAEIAIRMSGPRDHPVLVDIAKHLDWLRTTAEEWAPRPGTGDEVEDEGILVLHVFKEEPCQIDRKFDRKNKVLVHSSIPEALDSALTDGTTNTQRRVHLYVHRSKKGLQREVDPAKATEAWWGEITTDSYAKEDRRNPGAPGEFSEISFEVQWPDEKSPPAITSSKGIEEGKGGSKQIVIRIDGPLCQEDWPIEYSISRTKVVGDRKKRSPVKTKYKSVVPSEVDKYLRWKLGNIDRKYVHFEGGLERGKVKVTGFENKHGRTWTLKDVRKLVPYGYDFEYKQVTPKTELHRYLYLSIRQWHPRR